MIKTPGDSVDYDVSIMKVQEYSLKDFFSYEKSFMVYNSNKQETEARTILNRRKDEGRNENKKETALKVLQDGELPIDKVAKYSGLDIVEVEQLAGLQTL